MSGGSIIAIILTRTGDGLVGFRESGYDGRATLTLVAEIVSVILVLIAIAMWRARDADGTTVPSSGDGGPAASARSGPSPAAVPSLVAGAVCAVFLLAVTLGIGVGDGEDGQPPVAGVSTTTGDATPSTTDDPATGDDPPVAGEGRSATEDGPTTTDDPVAALGATADTGRDTFTGEGCGGCHRLADAGTGGAIGPDLDRAVADLDADAIRRLIVDPPAGPMPSDYADRIDPERLDALAAYLAAAAGAR
ncbi:MAG: c-type cytochrome [Solirubrobacteraceae bacterium]